MKTVIIALSIAIFALAGNINNAFSKDNFYKSDEMNKAGQITKTTVFIGEDGKNLIPVKQFENKYDDNGTIRERILFAWDSQQSKWDTNRRYQYEYTSDGQLQMVSYTTFNQFTNKWENEIEYAMYLYNPEGKLLLVNYLNTENKVYDALASDFSIE